MTIVAVNFLADWVHRIYVHQHNITHYYMYMFWGKKHLDNA